MEVARILAGCINTTVEDLMALGKWHMREKENLFTVLNFEFEIYVAHCAKNDIPHEDCRDLLSGNAQPFFSSWVKIEVLEVLLTDLLT